MHEELFGEYIEDTVVAGSLLASDGEDEEDGPGPEKEIVEARELDQMVATNDDDLPERPFDKLPAEIIAKVS